MASYTGPRFATNPPPLYIPDTSPTQRQNGENPFRDSIAGITEMYQVPITPARSINTTGLPSPTNRSHFSPDTPDIEKGLGRGDRLRPQDSISSRFMRGVRSSRNSQAESTRGPAPAPAPATNGQNRSKWIPWIVVGVILLFLIVNVIYLDIRMMSTNTVQAGPKVPAAAIASASSTVAPSGPTLAVTPSLAPSATPRATAVNLQGQNGTPGLSTLASSCMSGFPRNAATNVVSFCSTCYSELTAIPSGSLNLQDPDQQLLSQSINNAIVLCKESGFAPS